jgi:hypothetical protein
MTGFNRNEHGTKWIAVKEISVVWAQAQRGLNEREAKRIAEQFDPDAFGTVTVTMPNGNGVYHCIDGQTRVAAVKIALGEDQAVPCNVISAADPKKAADIFSKMNGGRSKPNSMERFRVAVTAGYPVETAVANLLKQLEYHVGLGGQDGTFRAVVTACAIYRKHGFERLRDALIMLRATWGMEPTAVDSIILNGYVEFMSRYHNEFDGKRLIQKMQKEYSPSRLLGAAKGHGEIMKMSRAASVCALMLLTYNEGLHKKHKLG